MKKRQTLAALALILIIALAFTACGAKSAVPEMNESYDMAMPAAEPEAPMGNADYSSISEEVAKDYGAHIAGGGGETAAQTANPDEKIIYSGYARVETLEFDKSIESLLKMVSDCGGFIQYSDVTGSDFDSLHSGRRVYRYASYTLRIPASDFKGFTEGLSAIGNVPYSSTNAENITMQYRDTDARLKARETEQTRLLELLSKAETVEDIMTIESRLSEVRYEIESLTSQIKNWDNQVSYSTLNVELQEVALYTEDTPATLSYGQQLKEGFLRSLKDVGRFFKDLFKFIVTAVPVLVVLAVGAVIVVVKVKAVKKRRYKKQQKTSEKDE